MWDICLLISLCHSLFHSDSCCGSQVRLFDSAHRGISSGFHSAQADVITHLFQGLSFSIWVLFLDPSLFLSKVVCCQSSLILTLGWFLWRILSQTDLQGLMSGFFVGGAVSIDNG